MSSSDDDDVFGAHQSGAADLKGRRSTMEDAHINEPELEDAVSGSGLYAVFDGHGGSKTSDWVAKNFASAFVEHPGVTGYPPDFDTAFKDLIRQRESVSSERKNLGPLEYRGEEKQ